MGTNTCLLFLGKAGNNCFHYSEAHKIDEWRSKGSTSDFEIIDQLVYRLYDLTEEEIKIVESET